MGEKKTSTVRRRVCRVAASMTIAGEQDASVQVSTATTGEPAVAVRIGAVLIYVEDTKALTSLVEAVVGASVVGGRIFGEVGAADARRAAAWKAMRSRNRHYAWSVIHRRPLRYMPSGRHQFSGLMTIYPHRCDRHDAEGETYMHWLDKNGFPAMRQLLADQGCEDVVVLRSVPNREALGVFHAVSTRDGEAQARDGQAFYALNPLDSQTEEAIVEIQFGDGLWMLATPDDLEMTGFSASNHAE